MRTFSIPNLHRLKYQSRYVAVIGALLLGIVSPGFVSAAQVTQRSIALSSASVSASNVTYEVNFTSVDAGAAFVVDFCSDSPLIGQTCTAPTDFDASSATTSTGTFSINAATDANTVVVDGTVAAATQISVELDAITNPSEEGTIYARIVTYDTPLNAASYASTVLGSGALDQGGVALSITPTVNVSGAVLETMVFCVSGDDGAGSNPITDDCGGTLTAPSLELGETTGGVTALSSSAVSTGTVYTQISTNAADGAVVSIKSNAAGCGGLELASDLSACYIAPAGTGSTISASEAKFGVKVGPESVTDTNEAGTIALGTSYSESAYHLNYVGAETSGVTGPYGDPVYNTNNDPANNLDMPLEFGASIANNTPAGKYSADLSLIATGTY